MEKHTYKSITMNTIYYSLREFKTSYDLQFNDYQKEFEDSSELEFCSELKKSYEIYRMNVTFHSEIILDSIGIINDLGVEDIIKKITIDKAYNHTLCKKYSKSFTKIICYLDERILFLSNESFEDKLFRISPFINRTHFDIFMEIKNKLNETKKMKWTLIFEYLKDSQKIYISETVYMTFIRDNFQNVGLRLDKSILNKNGIDIEIQNIVKNMNERNMREIVENSGKH